jgi:hypothetical protein
MPIIECEAFPPIYNALQWNDNLQEFKRFVGSGYKCAKVKVSKHLLIESRSQILYVHSGDWVLKDQGGGLSHCRKENFDEKYRRC